MINQVNDGIALAYTASANISAGDLVSLGNGLVGIAVDDIANGATGVVVLRGRFTVPKGSTAAIARGAALKLGTAGNTVVAATAGTTVNNFLCARPVVASTTAMTTVEIVIGI
jgi:predicted RecA/RadA family phage recombinase